MSLVGVFTALSITGYVSFEKFFMSRSAESEVRTILDRARTLAIGMYENDGWSFRIENNGAMIFKGDDFSTRDDSFDEIYELKRKTTATTTSDIYFEPITGNSLAATTTITSGSTTIDIFVSDNGIIR